MSPLDAIRAVYRSSLSSRDKAVAVAWCSHLGDGVASAGPSLLSRETGLSHSTCKRALAALRKAGILKATGKARTTETGTYQLDRFDPAALPAAERRSQVQDAPPRTAPARPAAEEPGATAPLPEAEEHGVTGAPPGAQRHDPPGHSGTTPRGTAARYGGQAGGQAGGQIPP